MFRIHIINISLMLVCGIGFLLWGTIISYKTKYHNLSSTVTASEEHESRQKTTSSKIKSTVATAHANVKKEEAKIQKFEEDIVEKSLQFSREAVKMALWLQENLSIAITDWQSISGEMLPNLGTSMISGLVSNSSYSESSSYRKSVSNLASPLSSLPPGTLSITVKEMSTETEEESRISGSHGERNLPKENTKSNRTSSTGSSSSSSRSNSVSDDHGDSPSTGTRIEIGDEVEGEINPEGDKDYFVFNGKAKEVIDIDITAESLGSDLDSYITLFGPDGSRLAYNDDSGYSFDSSISNFELPKTGTYKLEVRAFGNGGGPGQFYNLTVVNP
jgi:hypothetical protein